MTDWFSSIGLNDTMRKAAAQKVQETMSRVGDLANYTLEQ
jgi:hypothetical protein